MTLKDIITFTPPKDKAITRGELVKHTAFWAIGVGALGAFFGYRAGQANPAS